MAALNFATTCSVGTTLLPDMCPQRLGMADVDGVAVTGIKDRAD
jgi:hypothetical protein